MKTMRMSESSPHRNLRILSLTPPMMKMSEKPSESVDVKSERTESWLSEVVKTIFVVS